MFLNPISLSLTCIPVKIPEDVFCGRLLLLPKLKVIEILCSNGFQEVSPQAFTLKKKQILCPSSLPLVHPSLPIVPSPFPNTRPTTTQQLIRTGSIEKKKKLHNSTPSLLLTDQINPANLISIDLRE